MQVNTNYTLLNSLVEYVHIHDYDDLHVMVGSATFKKDFGPWKAGETIECLIIDYQRGYIEEQNDDGEVLRKVPVIFAVDPDRV